jgi:hypothetical protein
VSPRHQTSVVINGKRYNAHTGEILSHPNQDGPKSVAHSNRTMHETKTHQAKHIHHNPERSKTLMRQSVKKPIQLTASKPASGKVMTDVVTPVKTLSSPATLFYHQQDVEREKRAQKIRQSELVRKFNHHGSPAGLEPITKKIQALEVQPAPATVHPMAPSLHAAERLIEKGLRAAQSHDQPKHHSSRHKRSKRTRLASIGAASIAVLLLGAFFALQNVPNISMRYAAAKAGVSAQLPNYFPSGFSLNNHIQYNPGQITLKFSSNSDERDFSITQRTSNWDSDTLMNSYVANASDQVQTFEDKGRTIYLYGESNATWVNGGVWYDIQGNAMLNSDQLIRIATSM